MKLQNSKEKSKTIKKTSRHLRPNTAPHPHSHTPARPRAHAPQTCLQPRAHTDTRATTHPHTHTSTHPRTHTHSHMHFLFFKFSVFVMFCEFFLFSFLFSEKKVLKKFEKKKNLPKLPAELLAFLFLVLSFDQKLKTKN